MPDRRRCSTRFFPRARLRYTELVTPSLVRVAALTGAILAVGVAVGYRLERESILTRSVDVAAQFTLAVADDLEDSLAHSAEDIRFLADLAVVRAALDDDAAARYATAATFVSFAKANTDVSQVRLLDAEGRERIRIDRRDSAIKPTTALQNKGDRYYVKAALALGLGEIYVSRLDLNVERGVVERPPHPVVRFAAPVFVGAARRPAGVVVTNLDAKPLLSGLTRWTSQANGLLVLIDDNGTYSSHPDPTRLWGAGDMLATGASFTIDEPEVAKWAAAQDVVAARRGDGRVVAVAPVPRLDGAPRVVLVASESTIISAAADELWTFAGWVGAVGIAAAAFLLGLWWRQRERRRQSRAVAAATSTTLTQAAAALAHEVRNPLGAIVNSAGLLEADFDDDSDTAQLLSIVRAESARLERIVDDFVELARPRPAEREIVDLADLVRDTVALAKADPRFAGAVQLDAQIDAATPRVRADADQLRQVLWNLLRNAGDASARAGGAGVRVRTAPGWVENVATAIIEVEDDGPGPPSSDSGRPGADRTGPTRGGLGLIVATGIAARHEGRLELRARRDARRGTMAVVELPALTEEGA